MMLATRRSVELQDKVVPVAPTHWDEYPALGSKNHQN